MPTPYILQSDVETYLDITLTGTGQALFAMLLPALTDLINNYCNRSWDLTNPITETFDAISQTGTNYDFFLQNNISPAPANNSYPLAQGIISITIGNSPIDLNYVVSYGSYVRIAAAFPSVLLANPLGYRMVQITYNADSTLPTPIKLALIEWIARKIQNAPDAGKETTRVQVGTVQAYYAQDKIGGIPEFVRFVLDQYRIPALDHF